MGDIDLRDDEIVINKLDNSIWQRIFALEYSDYLILTILDNNKIGAVSLNLISVLIGVIILHPYLSTTVLSILFLFNISILGIRLYLENKIRAIITQGANTKVSFLVYIMTILLSAVSFNIIMLIAIFNGISELDIVIFGILILSLAAGSISTIGSVFAIFFWFVTLMLIPLVMLVIHYGSQNHYIYAFSLILFYIFHIISGYRLFITHKRTHELENKYRAIYDKSSDGIALVDGHNIVESNDALLEMFGYGNDLAGFKKIPARKLSPKYQKNGGISIIAMMGWLHRSREEKVVFEWLHQDRYDREFWVEITLQSIEINNFKLTHGVWRDINARKLAENNIKALNATLNERVKEEIDKNRQKDQQLLQQSRLAQMGEMISMIAHQWRQPLSAISSIGGAIILKASLGNLDKETAQMLATNISKHSQHLSSTIDDFRNFFKSNKEKSNTTYTKVIESVLSIIEISMGSKNITLIKNLNSREKFDTYPNELKQVILNLIKNAEDVLLEKEVKNPTVTIETYGATLIVSDNAGGIPEDIIDKIFDPYFSTKTKKDGTGLGLYMSKTIIEDHCKGRLEVYNDHDGAVFKITL